MRFRVAWRDERGSAVAENAMTSVVIVAVFLLVCQFAYAAHVRSSLTMAAAEAARVGARVDGGVDAAQAKARDLLAEGGGRHARVSAGSTSEAGVAVMRVDITAQVPVLGPFGVGLDLHTSGRAVIEDRGP